MMIWRNMINISKDFSAPEKRDPWPHNDTLVALCSHPLPPFPEHNRAESMTEVKQEPHLLNLRECHL